MSKPPAWPEQIEAPKEALKMYRCMARLQYTGDFKKCHVFTGASTNGIPVISWESKATGLAKVICSFMGLEYKRRTCNTKGCINPFHHILVGAPKEVLPVPKLLQPEPVQPVVDLKAYVELIEYYVEENEIEEPTFEKLRELIPAEDITDEILRKAIHEYDQKL